MAFAPWLTGPRSARSRRYDRSKSEDVVKLDLTEDPSDIAKEIFTALSANDLHEGKMLAYLNNFVKLILHISSDISLLGYAIEEILYCLRYCVTHESSVVRAGAFRAMRHVIANEEDIARLNELHIPYLIVRALDLEYKNDAVRVEAVKLTRKAMLIAPARFHIALARYLVALANGIEEKDRMLRVYLAVLCELGTLNPDSFISTGGVAAITRNLLECQTPKISESLCGVLLLLLDRPITRNHAGVDLHCVAAPYCDFHYRHGWMDKNRDERELKFNCSRLALLTILRSWPGILHFCSPNDVSGFKAIVDVLYLNQLEVRKAVLDLLYELLNLPQPEWTDELSVALSAVDPAEPQASWRLGEGFVAAEGRSILPHLARTTPSISDMHLSLLLYCFLETGLLGALSEVIATSDTFISVRATVLLGELLRLIQVLLPPECCNITPALPNLIEYATTNPQALRAITALQQLHKLLKRRPASQSLYLDYILRSGSSVKTSLRAEKLKRHKASTARIRLTQLVTKDADDAVKDTGVLANKDAFTWNWNVIQIILRRESDFILDLTDQNHRAFLKRLVEYFLPSSNRYSHMDLSSPKNPQGYTTAGIELIDCLAHMRDPLAGRFLGDLVRDICQQIEKITQGKSAHDCLFSPQHMGNTQCQTYFLFIGRLAASHQGAEVLESFDMFNKLKNLATTTKHDCYVKLIISSLDYCENAKSHEILSAVLKCANESSRLYATQFLLVLLRAGLPNFDTWGIKLLAEQLSDRSRTVYLSALSTLHEACEVSKYLEQLIQINPKLLHLEEKGALLLIRYLSVPSGFSFLNRKNFVINELRRWDEYFNYRYVFIIEGETADALTQHQKGEDGRYDKRTTSSRSGTRADVFLPPHLYGQLTKHAEGLKILDEHGSIPSFIQTIENALGLCETEEEILKIKAALWALGHLCNSVAGLEFIVNKNVLLYIVHLAEGCVVWSIKATAFYVLGLIATTDFGADCLFKLGWVSTRHDRHDRWPVIQEEHWHLNQELAMEMSEQDQLFDYSIYVPADADSSTIEDDMIYMSGESTSNRKSSTLPPHSNYHSGQHTRSLSESKTFDYLRVRRDTGSHRYRDNSITESTTSGVSSCESAIGKSVLNEVSSTLTPIPSISSLLTIKTGGKLRRHSESSRTRINSDRSTVSPAGSTSGKLSFQDHMGYKIIRHIKMQAKDSDDEMDSLPPALARVHSLDRTRYPSTSDGRSSSLMNFIKDGLSLASLASVNKFSIKEETVRKKKGQLYMGIALPLVLVNLFPEYQVAARRLSYTADRTLFGSDTSTDSEISAGTQSSTKKSRFIHRAKGCMVCGYSRQKEKRLKFVTSTSTPNTSISEKSSPPASHSAQDDEITSLKISILNQIEMLSNPLVQKHFRHNLLNLKQKHPEVFQDPCLYSDVCKMLSDNSYRLMTRRFIQDIFFDSDLEPLSRELKVMFSAERERVVTCATTPGASRKLKTFSANTSLEEPKTYQQTATEERKAELAPSSDGLKKKRKEVLSVTVGFTIEQIQAAIEDNDMISPTRYQASSPPPLTSVKEENMASSSENMLEFGVHNAEVQVHAHAHSQDGNDIVANAMRPNSISLPVDKPTPNTWRSVEQRNSTSLVSPSSSVTSPTSPMNHTIKTLEELKLTYKENKFPIKRDDKTVK